MLRVPLLLLLAAGMARAQPQPAARTHTFASYQNNPTFQPLVPVFVGTVNALESTYFQDDIVSISGVPLPSGGDYVVDRVWQSPRRRQDWTSIGTSFPFYGDYFEFKLQNGRLRLMANLVALGLRSYTLFFNRRELRSGDTNSTVPKEWGVNPYGGLAYDPDPSDGVDPYFSDCNIPADQRRQRKAERWEARYAKKEARAWRMYDRWVQKQLGGTKTKPVELTMEQVTKFYLNPTNKRFPYKYTNDLRGDLEPGSGNKNAGAKAASAEGGVHIANLISSSYTYDYAVIFRDDSNRNNPLQRIDLTIGKWCCAVRGGVPWGCKVGLPELAGVFPPPPNQILPPPPPPPPAKSRLTYPSPSPPHHHSAQGVPDVGHAAGPLRFPLPAGRQQRPRQAFFVPAGLHPAERYVQPGHHPKQALCQEWTGYHL